MTPRCATAPPVARTSSISICSSCGSGRRAKRIFLPSADQLGNRSSCSFGSVFWIGFLVTPSSVRSVALPVDASITQMSGS